MPDVERFVAEAALRPLKKFQRRTVDYVVRRFYEDSDATMRFLVADEVGLGKTMVARGVIARAIERLWDSVERIDVLYICSNQAIAGQNINRLNVLGKEASSLPTRMTLLPLQLTGDHGPGRNKVNFISLTPGTTFNLRSSTGISRERALLFHLLAEVVEPRRGLCNLLQVGAGVDSWHRILELTRTEFAKVDRKLIDAFRTECTNRNLIDGLAALSRVFHRRRSHYPQEMTGPRNRAVAELRSRLAHVCVDALEPDLIILDEFQRFTELLHGDHDAALLARDLFDYTDREGNAARTLLLSATPYRMLTLSGDTEDDGNHHREFLETLRFLYGQERGPVVAAALGGEIDRFRRAMFSLPHSKEIAREHKLSIEDRLQAVIARTERVASTRDRDSMVEEPNLVVGVAPEDLRSAAAVAEVARVADAPEVVEYWKSAPYLLNFMRDYALKRAIGAYDGKECPAPLLDAIKAAQRTSLTRGRIREYRPLTPPNGRMRLLMDDVFRNGLDQHLWIPPSLPYYGDGDSDANRTSKSLVFSSWSVVPDAVAAVLSYEAERRMGVKQAGMRYFDRQRPRPLQFRIAQGRLAGLRALLLIYPSPLIAQAADPLDVVAGHAETLSYGAMRAALASRLEPHLRQLRSAADESSELETWQWAGPAVLDALAGKRSRVWLEDANGFARLGAEDAWGDHVNALRKAVGARRIGGTLPDSALELLVDLALGSPAICALRAMRRIAPTLEWDDPALLTAASRVAWGFRTLYNQHDTVALLRRESDDRYWHNAISHGARNNLQAVLDEYVHCLVESEGLTDKEPRLRVAELASAVVRAISLLPSQIEVDEPRVRDGRLRIRKSTMRGRFAMRLADYRDEEGSAARLGGVRDAFNSPFRPFVLATTSIGQEGLDFHPYCHRLYHWNLPRNPVDLEQREGRVHRYKGHAIRLNVAAGHAEAVRGCGATPEDPWAEMFAAARAASPTDSDLVPYWICDGPAKVERRVPMLPYSREIARLKWLKKSVAVYRLAFGQPRQDDLLAYLSGLDGALTTDEMDALQIRLEPPVN